MVAVQVAVLMVAIAGFAALTIDVGAMYSAKADLQRAADAAALGAASKLAAYDEGNPTSLARAEAQRLAGLNTVFGRNNATTVLGSTDVEFGRAVYNEGTGSYDFQPTNSFPDAVRVRVRLEQGSPNGPLSLYFARIFGHDSADVAAEAVAMMVPRDIAVVADLSGSHTDDSELGNYKATDVNLYEVWQALPVEKGNNGVGNGIDPPPPGNPNHSNDEIGTWPGSPGNQGGNPDPGADPQGGEAKGPTWGLMYYWGDALTSDYSPSTDPALFYRPKGQNWNDTELADWYAQIGYSQTEINALLSSAYDNNGAWDERVAVALGLARWDSGIPGGLWEDIPPGHRNTGNGNAWLGSGELTWLVDYPYPSGSWEDYFNYTANTYSQMYRENHAFRYEMGIKTFVNYLLENNPSHSQTPDLALTPTQPMQAVKDAVTHLAETLVGLETDDRLSLEIYGTTARHEVDLTEDYDEVADRLNEMQAAHYDSWTNMGGGIERAIEELTNTNSGPDGARATSRKVIFLLTDGMANVTANGHTGDYTGGANYARTAAASAASHGIRIFTVSVGSGADQALMEEIATMGSGLHFHAQGSIDTYSVQLEQIFQTLGGTRPVELIR